MSLIKISTAQAQIQSDLVFLIEKKKFSQSKLANLTGRSTSVISEIINGKRAFAVGVLNIISERLAKYLNKSELVQEVEQYQTIWNTATKAIKGQENAKKVLHPTFELVVGGSGLGKTEVFREFANQDKQYVYMVRLDRGMSWRELLEGIAYEMGILKEEGKGSKREVKRMQSSKLLDLITRKIEEMVVDEKVGNFPVLIIDEAEEIPNATLRKIKNLYTATEGMLSIIICGINKTKNRLYKLAGMRPDGSLRDQLIQNEYTPFVRRLNVVVVPQISIDDLRIFCNKKGITSQKAIDIIYPTGLWWNYQIANDMINNEGAERLNQLKSEAEFRVLCSQFM